MTMERHIPCVLRYSPFVCRTNSPHSGFIQYYFPSRPTILCCLFQPKLTAKPCCHIIKIRYHVHYWQAAADGLDFSVKTREGERVRCTTTVSGDHNEDMGILYWKARWSSKTSGKPWTWWKVCCHWQSRFEAPSGISISYQAVPAQLWWRHHPSKPDAALWEYFSGKDTDRPRQCWAFQGNGWLEFKLVKLQGL